MQILPEVVAALEGEESVKATIARRSLDDETYQSQRFHTEKVGRFQGIVLAPRTEQEKTHDLQKLARRKLNELELVLVELARRPPPTGFHSSREAIAAELPKGILMTKGKLDESEAFRRLQKLASDKNRKLVEIASILLTAEEAFQSL